MDEDDVLIDPSLLFEREDRELICAHGGRDAPSEVDGRTVLASERAVDLASEEGLVVVLPRERVPGDIVHDTELGVRSRMAQIVDVPLVLNS